MKKRLFAFIAVAILAFCLAAIVAFASEDVKETYDESDNAYTIYTDSQYQEVIKGIYDETLENKTIRLGCTIDVKYDFIMDKALDVTIDLNGFTLNNNYKTGEKLGDFDMRHDDAIIRIKNGGMTSTFCVFVFRNQGQVYLENVDIVSAEECVYHYGGYSGVLSFKNCNIDITQNYSVMGLGNCGKGGFLYQIDGGTYDGLNIHCANPGSYIRNCTVYNREFFVDSWHQHGGESDNADVEVEITNVKCDVQFRLNDPRVDPMLYDCDFAKIVMGGNQKIVSHTSPTCTEAGTRITYNGSVDNAAVDEQYPIDNPAKGHSASETVIERYFAKSKDGAPNYFANQLILSPCTYCSEVMEFELDGSALFTKKGVTLPETEKGSAICHTIVVNLEAINEYNAYFGGAIKYGVVVGYANDSAKPVNSDGTNNGNYIIASFEGTDFSYIQTKITGLENVTKDIYCSAYAINEGEVTYLYEGDATVTATAIKLTDEAEAALIKEAIIDSREE